jgi:hypothetical protein
MAVVENDHGSRRQTRKEGAKIAAGEIGQIGEIFRGKSQQGRRMPAARLRRGKCQIVEERRGIGVAGIDVVPDARQAPRFKVACPE